MVWSGQKKKKELKTNKQKNPVKTNQADLAAGTTVEMIFTDVQTG